MLYIFAIDICGGSTTLISVFYLYHTSNYSHSKAFFFDYLVYGTADPIFQDFEDIFFLIFTFFLYFNFFFFLQNVQLSVPSLDNGGVLASGAIRH